MSKKSLEDLVSKEVSIELSFGHIMALALTPVGQAIGMSSILVGA
jgi:hypothetical protein